EQVFCEGATIADLIVEPTSTNTQGYRWYSTINSNPALDPTTPLVNGEIYYASQIVNRTGRNQLPCESTDRFAVEVTLEGGTIVENTQRFCESIGENNDFDQPRVRNLVSQFSNPVWYADEALTTILDPETLLENDEDYFTSDSNNCQIERVIVDLFDTPNAGMTTQVSFCANEPEVNLVDFIRRSNNLPDEEVSQDGYFTPSLENNVFNPGDYQPGSYDFTY